MHGCSSYFSTGMTWFNFPDVKGRKLHQHACGCVITKLSAIYDFCANSNAERHGTDGVCNCHLVSVMCWRVVKQDSSAMARQTQWAAVAGCWLVNRRRGRPLEHENTTKSQNSSSRYVWWQAAGLVSFLLGFSRVLRSYARSGRRGRQRTRCGR
jgi:hypothetical protein